MVKLLPNSKKLREDVYKTLKTHVSKLKQDKGTIERMIMDAFAQRAGWWGRRKPSFKTNYHLLALSMTYWCRHNPSGSIRNWLLTKKYPVEMGFDYKLGNSKAKTFLFLFRCEVLNPHKFVHGIFVDPLVKDLYDCLHAHGLIRSTTMRVYKTIRW